MTLLFAWLLVWVSLLVWFVRRLDRPRPMTELIQGELELAGVVAAGSVTTSLLLWVIL